MNYTAQIKSEMVEMHGWCSVLCYVLKRFLTAKTAHNGMVIDAKKTIYIYICFTYRIVYAFALVLMM